MNCVNKDSFLRQGELCWGSGQEFPAASHLSVFGSDSSTLFFSFCFSYDLLCFGASSSMGIFEVSWFIALIVRAHHKEALIPPYHWRGGARQGVYIILPVCLALRWYGYARTHILVRDKLVLRIVTGVLVVMRLSATKLSVTSLSATGLIGTRFWRGGPIEGSG